MQFLTYQPQLFPFLVKQTLIPVIDVLYLTKFNLFEIFTELHFIHPFVVFVHWLITPIYSSLEGPLKFVVNYVFEIFFVGESDAVVGGPGGGVGYVGERNERATHFGRVEMEGAEANLVCLDVDVVHDCFDSFEFAFWVVVEITAVGVLLFFFIFFYFYLA